MKGILTDLDGTLLNIDMNVFIPQYLKAMNDFAVKLGLVPEKNHLVPQVLKGTDAMMKSQDFTKTNEEVFWDCFFSEPHFAEKRDQMMDFFEQFYAEVFPQLHIHCQQFAFAEKLVEAMFETGLKVAVATSPLFPLAAINARLKWAGVADYPWRLKTSYENMHSCKPHISYFEETVQMVGLTPPDCLMIGNDKQDDLPAGRIGIRTYLLEEFVVDDGKGYEPPAFQGNAEALVAFLKTLRA